jgi:hypothetical protein
MNMRATLAALVVMLVPVIGAAQTSLIVQAKSGLRVTVDEQNDLPALRLRLPDETDADPGIFVLLPEHVTARERGQTDHRQLYRFRPGRNTRPTWRRNGPTIEYEMDLRPGLRMRVQTTLEEDGVRHRYEFVNDSKLDYEMIQAVTDPRMVSPYFRDVRLERTYVHHDSGFELIAAESPNRMNLPLNEWLPNRHRVPYTWTIDTDRIGKQPDGIIWYNKSKKVDEPFIATRSTDGEWTVATFSFDPGNVWVNPELTCQHADPQLSLAAGETRRYKLKTLVMRGTLEDALAKVRTQRPSLER